MRILLIDDNRESLDSLAEVLREAGHECVAFGSSVAAVFLLRREHFDLVVSDFHMPRMTGRDVVRACRDLDPPLPVVVVSGRFTAAESAELIESGASAFMEKPVDARVLIETIRLAVDTAKSQPPVV